MRYLIAVTVTLLAAVLRYQVTPTLKGSGPFVFFSFAVAISAFVGGLGPGVVATALSLVLSIGLFILPARRPLEDVALAWVISATAGLWLFTCITCDLLRRLAISYKQAAEERDESRERLALIFDSLSDAFFAVDNDWRITHCNSSFLTFVGKEGQDVGGANFLELIGKYKDLVFTRLNIAKLERTTESIDVQEPGSERWWQFRIFPDVSGMSGYIQEATYRKRIEEHNEHLLFDEKRARTEAERASQLKDEFIATLSHELRTPLTAILGWSELLKSRPGIEPKVMEGLEAIERSTRLQAQLVEELLDMSRVSVGKVSLDMQVLDLHEVASAAFASFRPAATAKQIDFAFTPSDEEILVRADYSRILQVVSNLLSNAIKFTPAHGSVRLGLEKNDRQAVIRVNDTGKGIDEAFLPYLFDRFRQADATTTRSHGGLGLGLAIAKQLVDLHHGTLIARSGGEGLGSEFVLSLPLAALPAAPLEVAGAMNDVDADVSGLRVLVVDDDRDTRELLKEVLRQAGATVEARATAREALDLISQFAPNVLLSDIGMPEMDGYEFIRKVRQRPADEGGSVPAAAVTAFARDEDCALALDAGFDAHLAKPIEQKRLLQTVASLACHAPSH
ncbi:MAG: response regulator [Armatimonadetes bacterium]|nr:response regulator [Armatimonadota bacterium]